MPPDKETLDRNLLIGSTKNLLREMDLERAARFNEHIYHLSDRLDISRKEVRKRLIEEGVMTEDEMHNLQGP